MLLLGIRPPPAGEDVDVEGKGAGEEDEKEEEEEEDGEEEEEEDGEAAGGCRPERCSSCSLFEDCRWSGWMGDCTCAAMRAPPVGKRGTRAGEEPATVGLRRAADNDDEADEDEEKEEKEEEEGRLSKERMEVSLFVGRNWED